MKEIKGKLMKSESQNEVHNFMQYSVLTFELLSIGVKCCFLYSYSCLFIVNTKFRHVLEKFVTLKICGKESETENVLVHLLFCHKKFLYSMNF
jgi:hypothetical protein